MTWVLAIGGIILLVVLHELGHFLAGKAVGMRIERFFLFFPPKLFSRKIGETEYGIGAIPAGGFVKITGMNPDEELSPEVAARGYYNQPVWKRIVTIAAGPAMNFLIAFVILFGLAFAIEEPTKLLVGAVSEDTPAEGRLAPGDEVVSVDGIAADGSDYQSSATELSEQVGTHICKDGDEDGCRATTPATVVVERGGETKTLEITPYYDGEFERYRLGYQFEAGGFVPLNPSVPEAAGRSLDFMWLVTSETVSTFAQIFKPEEREKLGSIAGAAKATSDAFDFSTEQALQLIAVISLSLALINLFPFLPLDGGHIFWSVVEKVRGKRPSFRIMERAGVVGFVLILFIFFIGLSNDIERFSNGSFGSP
ncbi:MAG: M50 family metallopeptidase [Solirubrobacterales bacterium]